MTIVIASIAVFIVLLWGIILDSDIGEDRFAMATIIVVAAIITTVFVAAIYEKKDRPRIEYADCIIEHQDIDKCAVLMPEKDGE